MPSAEGSISSPGLILCEGIDDFAVLLALLQHLRIDRSVLEVERLQGRRQLHDRLNALPVRDRRSLLRSLGIVCDADTEEGPAAFGRVRDDLRNTGYEPPTTAGGFSQGEWGGGPMLNLGVFIMPDNHGVGALEDLCLAAINGDPSLSCVDEFLSCVAILGSISWREQDRSKARLNAWLASREDPTRRLGQAITAGVISATAPAFRPLRDFLTRLAAAANASETPPV